MEEKIVADIEVEASQGPKDGAAFENQSDAVIPQQINSQLVSIVSVEGVGALNGSLTPAPELNVQVGDASQSSTASKRARKKERKKQELLLRQGK